MHNDHRGQKKNLHCTCSCKNLTFTVTCFTVLCVMSLPFATAKSKAAVLSTHTMVLSLSVCSACLLCKLNRVALKYLTFTATIASAVHWCYLTTRFPEHHDIAASPFFTTTFSELDLAMSGHSAKSVSAMHTKCWASASNFWVPI